MTVVARAELVKLFVGDEVDDLWAPCHSRTLAQAICERYKPASFAELRTLVFGCLPVEEVLPSGMVALEEGWDLWREHEKRRKRRKEKV